MAIPPEKINTEELLQWRNTAALLLQEGTAMLQKILDVQVGEYHSGTLKGALKREKPLIDELAHKTLIASKKPKTLSDDQYDLLLNSPTEEFDITLLAIVLLHILPIQGPQKKDIKDIVVKVRDIRNKLFHRIPIKSGASVKKELQSIWDDLQKCLQSGKLRQLPYKYIVSVQDINKYKNNTTVEDLEIYKKQIEDQIDQDLVEKQAMMTEVTTKITEIVTENLSNMEAANKNTFEAALSQQTDEWLTLLKKSHVKHAKDIQKLLQPMPGEISKIIQNPLQNFTHVLTKLTSLVEEWISNIKANKDEKCENQRLERSLSQEIEDKYKAQQRVQEKHRKELLQQLRHALKKNYSTRYRRIQFIPWHKTVNRDIDDIYIPLSLQEKRETDTWKRAESPQFKSLEDAIKLKEYGTVRSIITADAGCGKSTLCHKVMYDWSKDGSFFSDRYELVILLKARDFSSQQDILSAIMHQIPSKFDKNKDKIAETLKDENTKLLILIDGFDELKDKTEQKDLLRLLDQNLFENCDLIITTRPVFLEKLKEFELLDQVLAISLFEKDDIRAYATNFFEKNKDKNLVHEFCREINSGDFNHLAKEPLTLLFLCTVYEHRKCLPKIRTHLYEELLEVLQRTYTEKGRPEISDKDWNQLLLCLGNLAFNKLTEKEGGILVFKEKDVTKYKVELELACAVGLLTRADPPQEDPVSEYSRQSVLNKCDKFYQFAHLSLQECLAAKYFYNTFDNETSKQSLKTLQQQAGKLTNYTHFVCGYVSLDKEVNDEKLSMLNILLYAVFKYLLSRFDHYLVKDIEFWEETRRNPLYKWVVIDNDTIYHYYDNVPDGKTFCVEQVRYLNIPGMADKEPHNIIKCERGTCLRNICNILKDTHTLEHVILRHLKCDCKNRTDGLSELIQNNKNIENFCIEDCDISSDIAKSMVTHLPDCLTDLTLSNIPLEDRVCDIISKLPNTIERISLKDCCIAIKHETSIPQSISEFTTLKSLNLSDNNRIEKGIETIIANLNKSVCDLDMCNCGITDTVGESMSPHLAKLIALKELKLSGNPIGGGAVAVVEHLSDSLQSLHIQNCGITQTEADNMAPQLTKLKVLYWLELSGNPIGGGAVLVLGNLSDSIQNLHMHTCRITQTVAESMAPNLTKLKALNWLTLSGNLIGGGAVAVLGHLSHSIKYLDMQNCGITQTVAESMAPHLTKLKALNWLKLSGNPIGSGAVAVVEHLSDSIKKLHMRNCGITQTAAESMAPHLTKLKALNWLELSGSPIRGGAVAVVKQMSDSIQCLHMHNCGITQTVAESMGPPLTNLRALNWLTLSSNPIGGGAVEVLGHLSHSITYLDMENCGITQTVAESMAPHLTKLKALNDLHLSGNPIGGGYVAVLGHLCDSI